MSLDIRPISPEEFEAFTAAAATAFGNSGPPPEQLEHDRALMEFDRTLAAFDGEEIVGTTAIFSFALTVPGGALPTAGVTWVSVKPTHRRRGVLTRMMQQQLSDVRDRGEALAALWASESIIYDRYGYGLAAERLDLSIERTRTAFAREATTSGRCRLISRDEALSGWPGVYDRVVVAHPGMYTRSDTWWQHKVLRESASESGRSRAKFYVQYEEEGQPLGYARYSISSKWEDGLPNGTLSVRELMAATDDAYAALWGYLFNVDLIGLIEADCRRADEPLIWMLADPRRLVRRTFDTLWVRIVDLPAALEGRCYPREGKLTFEIRDSFCTWNEGRYELEAGPDGARCLRTENEPEIVLSAADLGAVYLGGTRLQTLHRAGRIQGDGATVRQADAMFAWDTAPWCPQGF